MKKILILGGCGYIGSELYNFLSPFYSVDTVDLEWYGNYVNENNIVKDMSKLTPHDIEKYDIVVLLAAHSSVKMCENNMLSTMKNNVFNFVELLNKINKNQIFIYASSSSVYGDTKKSEVIESYLKFEPNNFYDLSKYEIDAYAKLSNKKIFGLRFGTVNGKSPNLRSDIMINAMTYNAIKNGKVFCFNPEIYRPILGIADLCRAIISIIKKGTCDNQGIYNLASFNSTVKDISQTVAQETNVKLEIVDVLPEKITNIKLQTKAYNFLINSDKFIQAFDFEFKETNKSIVKSLIKDFDKINKGSRSDAKIY